MELSLDKITINYETYGDGRPLIILPGWSASARLTAHRSESHLQHRSGWKRIYIDPPGHGKTPGKEWVNNLDDMLDVVLEAIDALTDGRNFSLIGRSLGAYLARGVRYHRAAQIDGIALVVPLIISQDDLRSVPPFQPLVTGVLDPDSLTPEEAGFLEMSVVQDQNWLNQIRSFPAIPEGENGDADFLAKIRESREAYALSFDVDDLPDPFPGPSLFITGRQDFVVGYKDAWKILEQYPRATFAVLDRFGHLSEGADDLVYQLMNDWLDRLEESLAQ